MIPMHARMVSRGMSVSALIAVIGQHPAARDERCEEVSGGEPLSGAMTAARLALYVARRIDWSTCDIGSLQAFTLHKCHVQFGTGSFRRALEYSSD
jgi:hypothetical protein